MALAVTHVILTIVVLDLFRHYVLGKHKFPRYLLIVGGIAGLFPDMDIVFSWFYSWITGTAADFHGMFTHSIIFPIIFLVIALIFRLDENHKWEKICYVISFGWFFHLTLDCLYGGYKSFTWPFLNLVTNFCPQWSISEYAVSIDAIILVIWLVHEEVHNLIKDYV